MAERTETADIVVLGTVTAVRGPELHSQIAIVKVHSYLKGDGGPAQVEIRGFGASSLCLSPIQVGETPIIIFAKGDPSTLMPAHYSPWRKSSGEIAGFGGQFNAIASATAENIQLVSTAAGQEPVLPESRKNPLPLNPDTPTLEPTVTLTPIPARPVSIATPIVTPLPAATSELTPTPTPIPAPVRPVTIATPIATSPPTTTPEPTPTPTPNSGAGCNASVGGTGIVDAGWLLLGMTGPGLVLAGQIRRSGRKYDAGL